MSEAATEDTLSEPIRRFAEIRIDEVVRFPYNYREDFAAAELKELADSIATHGVLEPILVRRAEAVNGAAAGYEGLAGERRWRASRLASLETIPAIVCEGVSAQQAAEIALVENLQRQDVNPVEEARGLRQLAEVSGLKQRELAERVGRPRSTVANALRLLDLPDDVQELLRQGTLTRAHAGLLLKWRKHPRLVSAAAKFVVEHRMPAGALEAELEHADGLLLPLHAAGDICCIARSDNGGPTDDFMSQYPGSGSAFFCVADRWICYEKSIADDVRSKLHIHLSSRMPATAEEGPEAPEADGVPVGGPDEETATEAFLRENDDPVAAESIPAGVEYHVLRAEKVQLLKKSLGSDPRFRSMLVDGVEAWAYFGAEYELAALIQEEQGAQALERAGQLLESARGSVGEIKTLQSTDPLYRYQESIRMILREMVANVDVFGYLSGDSIRAVIERYGYDRGSESGSAYDDRIFSDLENLILSLDPCTAIKCVTELWLQSCEERFEEAGYSHQHISLYEDLAVFHGISRETERKD